MTSCKQWNSSGAAGPLADQNAYGANPTGTFFNRVQTYEQTRTLVQAARDHGLGGINVDLIYGLSLQTVDRFRKTVEQVIELRPDRIALYGYAHVTWLQKVQRTLEREHLPQPEERIRIFLEADILTCFPFI